jgi:serine protease Do
MYSCHPTFRVWILLCLWGVSASLGGDVRVWAEEADDALQHARALSLAFRRAAEQVKPAVVTVISRYKVRNAQGRSLRELLQDPRFREFFPDRLPFELDLPEDGTVPEPGNPQTPQEGQPQPQENPVFPDDFANNVGSGVVIDEEGVILTNNHVVQNADEVVVRFSDGSETTASEIFTDPLSDLAILRIQPETPLVAARLGDSANLEIGDWVIAIGSPFELEATVSAGIISAKGRAIPRIPRSRLLQTDAAINPGNSGGPLVSLDGDVVGISTAIATSSGGYQGVGFAIPSAQVKWISTELLEHGLVRRAFLGIQIGELTAEAARELKLRARSGVWVLGVYPESPAEKAGLQRDDVILDFGGIPVRAPGDLQGAVEQQPVGSSQEMKVMRQGENISLSVTVAALPERLSPIRGGRGE